MSMSGCKTSEEVGVEYRRLSRSGSWKKQGNRRAEESWGTGLDEEVTIATDLVCGAKHPRFIPGVIGSLKGVTTGDLVLETFLYIKGSGALMGLGTGVQLWGLGQLCGRNVIPSN